MADFAKCWDSRRYHRSQIHSSQFVTAAMASFAGVACIQRAYSRDPRSIVRSRGWKMPILQLAVTGFDPDTLSFLWQTTTIVTALGVVGYGFWARFIMQLQGVLPSEVPDLYNYDKMLERRLRVVAILLEDGTRRKDWGMHAHVQNLRYLVRDLVERSSSLRLPEGTVKYLEELLQVLGRPKRMSTVVGNAGIFLSRSGLLMDRAVRRPMSVYRRLQGRGHPVHGIRDSEGLKFYWSILLGI
jgi:hypothetical protein